MDNDPIPDPGAPSVADTAAARVALARWKRVLLIVAGVMVAIGLALIPFESGKREDLAKTQSVGGPVLVQGPGGALVPGDPNATTAGGDGAQADPNAADPGLSPALLKMGFSFFAAFAIGLACRSFVKLALIFVGLQLAALMGLSYVGWVTVNWETMSSAFELFASRVESEAQSFQTFVTGSLPQASLAGLGLFAGFKK